MRVQPDDDIDIRVGGVVRTGICVGVGVQRCHVLLPEGVAHVRIAEVVGARPFVDACCGAGPPAAGCRLEAPMPDATPEPKFLKADFSAVEARCAGTPEAVEQTATAPPAGTPGRAKQAARKRVNLVRALKAGGARIAFNHEENEVVVTIGETFNAQALADTVAEMVNSRGRYMVLGTGTVLLSKGHAECNATGRKIPTVGFHIRNHGRQLGTTIPDKEKAELLEHLACEPGDAVVGFEKPEAIVLLAGLLGGLLPDDHPLRGLGDPAGLVQEMARLRARVAEMEAAAGH